MSTTTTTINRTIVIVLYIVEVLGCTVNASNYLIMLYLLNNTEYPYNPNVRPSINDSVTEVQLIPNQFLLLNMDQAAETIEFFAEFIQEWHDPYLMWDRNESHSFDDEWIKLPEKAIWTPDTSYLRAISVSELLHRSERFVDVRYDGTVRQSSPSTIVVPCHLDIQSFPFDKQECKLGISSWMHNAEEIIMTTEYTYIAADEDFEGNSEWDLLSIYGSSKFELTNSINFSNIHFYVELTRRPVYYVLVIQAPTFITGTMTLFGIFSPFTVKGERRERVTLGLTMLLSITMMFTIVADMMPKAARLPLLGDYILAQIITCAVAVLVSVLILFCHHRAFTRCYPPPQFIVRFLRLTCLGKRDPEPEECPHSEQQRGSLAIVLETDSSSELVQLMKLRESLNQTVTVLTRYMYRKEREDAYQLTWHRIFDVIDLFCLVIFQSANIIMAIVYMKHPTMWSNILPIIPVAKAPGSNSTHSSS